MAGTVFMTGAAGFVGFHLARRMLDAGWTVVGYDGLTPYYSPALKQARLDRLQDHDAFSHHQGMLEEEGRITALVDRVQPDVIIHLAAQAGVRYSIDAPHSYTRSNLMGTHEVLEAARHVAPGHLVMASSSSVYGANTQMPYSERHSTVHPISFYASTKVANEAMAHSYAHLFGIPTTMLRFFTLYGPWGRPDMALFKFTRAILQGAPIDIYNHGRMQRDFTYIDDIVEGILRMTDAAPGTDPVGEMDTLSPAAPFRVVNMGKGAPEPLLAFVEAIEAATGRKARRNLMPLQPGDLPATWADMQLCDALVGPLPRTDLTRGVQHFVDWYRDWAGKI
ncbi:NAD-dependent epimerase/dehydratase family protein [Tateyamaria omphalii]|uniref:NAD-dependent epimerase/dehydratase domain-containing protein n=1 Tax=Tateyamaria omphalii TaxID=299262 RepID=A0A1P8N2H1_9RHOB|nr:NAD-dependent epimerase/dehydratase family protein [Tateyamaria omphalii]APX14379.1 hypothetical protein BWR18_21180 [Tateyamaria omphalii]